MQFARLLKIGIYLTTVMNLAVILCRCLLVELCIFAANNTTTVRD